MVTKAEDKAFKPGARYLGLGLSETVELYRANLHLLEVGMSVGKTHAGVGYQAFLAYCDFMHGGAYAAPISRRPFFMPDPTQSKWNAGELRNLPQEGLASYLAKFFSGTDAETAAAEILMDANVPHVFPKFLSDETFAKISISYSQGFSAKLFENVSTGVSTLVEAASKAAERTRSKKQDAEEDEGYSESEIQRLAATLALAGKAAASLA